MFVLIFFVINEPASAEIDSHLHPLSLHDALPILAAAPRGGRFFCPATMWEHGACLRKRSATGAPRRRSSSGRTGPGPGKRCGRRSEEHTSELQSLMRNSYAVFCLKKKNKVNK